MTDSGPDDPEPVVHPTQDDPVAATLSRGARRTRRRPRRATPVVDAGPGRAGHGGRRVRARASCSRRRATRRSGRTSRPATPSCATPTCPTSTSAAASPSSPGPTPNAISVRDRYQVMEYPVGIAYFACGTAYLTHWLSGSPNIDNRGGFSQDQLSRDPQVRQETMLFVAVTAIGFALCALLATWFLAGVAPPPPVGRAAVRGSRRCCCSSGLINWDLLAVVCVAGRALGAGRAAGPALTGVMIGLGTATKLYPLFLLGRAAVIAWGRERRWRRRWRSRARGRGDLGGGQRCRRASPAGTSGTSSGRSTPTAAPTSGSVWLMARPDGRRHQRGPHHQRRGRGCSSAAGASGSPCSGPGAGDRRGWPSSASCVVAGFLLVNKVYSPQYALWLLPLAVLARPRWRDLLVWQAGELFYFCAVWWYLGHYLDPGGGGNAGFYWMAIIVRVAAQLYLVAIVVRDVIGRSTTWCARLGVAVTCRGGSRWPRPARAQRPRSDPARQLTTTRSKPVVGEAHPDRRSRRRPPAPAARGAGRASRPACAAARRTAGACRRRCTASGRSRRRRGRRGPARRPGPACEWSPVGASRPMPCAVPPETTRMWPALRGRAAAVAEHVAALDLVDVEHGRGHREGAAVAEPERRCRSAGARRSRRSDDAQRGELGGGQVADPEGARRQPGRDDVVDQVDDLGEVGAGGQRQVEGDALEARPPRVEQLWRRRGAPRAVMPWRRMQVSRSSTIAGRAGSRVEQDHEVARAGSRCGSTRPGGRSPAGTPAGRTPRRQHQQVAVEALGDLGQLVVGADREGVDAEPLGLAGQAAEAEAVAVALRDRHQPGVGVGDLRGGAAASARRRRSG